MPARVFICLFVASAIVFSELHHWQHPYWSQAVWSYWSRNSLWIIFSFCPPNSQVSREGGHFSWHYFVSFMHVLVIGYFLYWVPFLGNFTRIFCLRARIICHFKSLLMFHFHRTGVLAVSLSKNYLLCNLCILLLSQAHMHTHTHICEDNLPRN